MGTAIKTRHAVNASLGDGRASLAMLGNVPPIIQALLIEEDGQLATSVAGFFAQHGVELLSVRDATQALVALESRRFDIVVVDLSGDGSGVQERIGRLRERTSAPLLGMVAPAHEEERIASLEQGADDCLSKPFHLGELLARMRAVLRRRLANAPSGPQAFVTGGLMIDFASHLVTVDGVRPQLTTHEFALLYALARHAGRPLSRDELLELIKGQGGAEETFDRAIDVHVSRLRTKIERDPHKPRYVRTIRGVGYLVARDS